MAVEALAYLAGLIDGDGCILILSRKGPATRSDRARGLSFIVEVKIGGDSEHLRGLRQEFKNIGSVYVRPMDHLAEWTIAGQMARSLLADTLPYLRLKKRQALLALGMPHPRTRWGVTNELRERQAWHQAEVRRLNHRGRGIL